MKLGTLVALLSALFTMGCGGGGSAAGGGHCTTSAVCSGSTVVSVDSCTGQRVQVAACAADQICTNATCVANPACTWTAVCGASDNKVYSENTCTHERAYVATCWLGKVCQAGNCVDPPVNPHVAVILSFGNLPLGAIIARFPHVDAAVVPPVIGSCVATVTTPGVPAPPVPQEAVVQVSLWGPSGNGIVVPEMTDAAYPYYLLVQPDNWNPAVAAGSGWRWEIIGSGTVPSFQVPFVVPEPITMLTPQAKGSGLIDFSRSSPPPVTWTTATFSGQQTRIDISGADGLSVGGTRILRCYPNETGSFQLPAVELLKFLPGQVGIQAMRYTAATVAAGLSGGGIVSAESWYQEFDSNGTPVPGLFTVN